MTNEHKGKFVLIVGPTCVGKTTLINALREKLTNTGVIISTTTRGIRPNEVNGVDYEFTTNEDFVRRREAGEFYEAVERPTGYYGSSRLQVHELLKKHAVVFGALDVEGCRIVKKIEPETLVIFLYPGDMSDLTKRLHERGTGDEEIKARLHVAEEEMLSVDEFDHSVENIDGKFEKTVAKVCEILQGNDIFAD
jgi:guanylate kinase